MELVLVAHRGGAAFHVAQGTPFVGDDQSPFELSRACGIDPEVAGKVHRAFYAFGNIAEAPVGEDCAVQGRKIVVSGRNDRSKVLSDKVRMFLHRL